MCSLPYAVDSGEDDISMADQEAAKEPDQDMPDGETAQAPLADQSTAATRGEEDEGQQGQPGQEIASVQLQLQDLALQLSDDDTQGEQTCALVARVQMNAEIHIAESPAHTVVTTTQHALSCWHCLACWHVGWAAPVIVCCWC